MPLSHLQAAKHQRLLLGNSDYKKNVLTIGLLFLGPHFGLKILLVFIELLLSYNYQIFIFQTQIVIRNQRLNQFYILLELLNPVNTYMQNSPEFWINII